MINAINIIKEKLRKHRKIRKLGEIKVSQIYIRG